MKEYDFVIVGSGLFGSVFARELTDFGKRCLVIEKRKHLGGNIYSENIEGINVHCYGPHIFHTNHEKIWAYVNSFVKFNNFIYSPLASYKGRVFNLPFNMNTFYQLWKVKTPAKAEAIIRNQILESGVTDITNLEEQAISLVGRDIYRFFIKGYTEKQWGRKASDLPGFIIKRVPIRFTYDNNYFNDRYQGIPIGGYNKLIEGLLSGIDVKTNVDFIENRNVFMALGEYVVYTGKIDEYYSYTFGPLEYRSLDFKHEILRVNNFQGVAVVNFTEKRIPYTRIIEHKHFEYGHQSNTVITKEFPQEWTRDKEAYYPINDSKNNDRFKKYRLLASLEKKVIFGGRLAEYKYFDMHQVIASALKKADTMKKLISLQSNTTSVLD